jgi:nitrogen fixation/metabolism regulation signal transduction histidine kinase
MGEKPYKRKLSNYLLNKSFQLKQTLFLVLVALAIFAVLGWLYYTEVKATTELMEIDQKTEQLLSTVQLPDDPYAAEFDQEMKQETESRDKRTSYLLLGTVAVLVLALACAGIYISHKVAGPLYALSLFIKAAMEGKWRRIRPFRKGDEFADVGDQFKALVDSIRKKHEDELLIINQALSDLEAAKADAARQKLSALAQDKKAYIDG